MEDASLEKSHRSVQVKSYERSENGTPTTSKWGTKQEGQKKIHWAFEPHWKEHFGVRTQWRKIQKIHWAFEPQGKEESGVRTQRRKCEGSVRTLCAAFEDTETWTMGICLSVRTLCGAFELYEEFLPKRSNPLCGVRRYRELENGILPKRSNPLWSVRTLWKIVLSVRTLGYTAIGAFELQEKSLGNCTERSNSV